MPTKSIVLFLCTGNYYRSRFAEIVFNILVQERKLKWLARSRGLRLSARNSGPISVHAVRGLLDLGITLNDDVRFPAAAAEMDFVEADRIVVLNREEHQPMISHRFDRWSTRLEYWDIDDVDITEPIIALPVLEKAVRDLVNRLAESTH